MATADQTALGVARALAAQLATTIESHVHATEAVAAFLATQAVLRPELVQNVLEAHVPQYPGLFGMYVGDADGRSIAYYPQTGAPPGVDYSDLGYFRAIKATGRTAISRVQLGNLSNVPKLQIASPIIRSNGDMTGYALASINLESIAVYTQAAAEGFSDGRIVVVDSEGRLLADSTTARVAQSRNLSRFEQFGLPSRNVSTLVFGRDELPRNVRSAKATITPDLGWRVIAMKTHEAVEAEAQTVRKIAVAITFLAMLVALILSAFLSGFLSRPLTALAEAAWDVSRGRISMLPEAVEGGPRELAQLSSALSRMVGVLRRDAEELEHQVAIRTRELTNANAELAVQATAMRHAGDAIEVTDAQGRYIFVNPAFEACTGYSSAEVIGRTPWDLLSENDASIRLYDAVRRGAGVSIQRGTSKGRRNDGSLFEQEITLAGVADEGGCVQQIVGVRKDVTELRQTEEALRVSGQLASVGTLAAGVAHEVNNSLGYLTTNLSFVLEAVQQHADMLPGVVGELLDALSEAQEGAARVRSIVRDLSAFARSSDEEGAVDVNASLELALKMVTNEIRHAARLVCEIERVAPVFGNPARLGQVFVNLLVNAVHAIEEGNADANELRVEVRQHEGQISVSISDTGTGMSENVLAHAFDPFFTTKDEGKGTGLGLSICQSIIHRMGGTLRAESRRGRGTTMSVLLPAMAAARDPKTSLPPASAEITEAHLRILVIDDERNVAKALKRVLREHHVELAFSGRAGLDTLSQEKYDVIICDLMMPDVSGMALFEVERTRHRDSVTKFIFMTGGAFTEQARQFVAERKVVVLAKPIPIDELRGKIADVARYAASFNAGSGAA